MKLKSILLLFAIFILHFSCSKDEVNLDIDNDGIENTVDNCPNTANANQSDIDGDGVGDTCDDFNDSDNDGVEDFEDNCPNTANPNQEDTDGDGVGDVCDTTVSNKVPCTNGFAGIYPCKITIFYCIYLCQLLALKKQMIHGAGQT